jgi:hypothetical protein
MSPKLLWGQGGCKCTLMSQAGVESLIELNTICENLFEAFYFCPFHRILLDSEWDPFNATFAKNALSLGFESTMMSGGDGCVGTFSRIPLQPSDIFSLSRSQARLTKVYFLNYLFSSSARLASPSRYRRASSFSSPLSLLSLMNY